MLYNNRKKKIIDDEREEGGRVRRSCDVSVFDWFYHRLSRHNDPLWWTTVAVVVSRVASVVSLLTNVFLFRVVSLLTNVFLFLVVLHRFLFFRISPFVGFGHSFRNFVNPGTSAFGGGSRQGGIGPR